MDMTNGPTMVLEIAVTVKGKQIIYYTVSQSLDQWVEKVREYVSKNFAEYVMFDSITLISSTDYSSGIILVY